MVAQRRAKKGGAGSKIAIGVLIVIIIASIVYGLTNRNTETRGGLVTQEIPKAYITVPSGTLITRMVPFDTVPELPITDTESGEPAWQAYECDNPDCPGRKGNETYKFAYNKEEMDRPFCPECKAAGFEEDDYTDVSRYYTPEAERELNRIMGEGGG